MALHSPAASYDFGTYLWAQGESNRPSNLAAAALHYRLDFVLDVDTAALGYSDIEKSFDAYCASTESYWRHAPLLR